MGLLRLIESARRQPRHVRDNLAFGVAIGVTALTAVVWLYIPFGNSVTTDEVVTVDSEREERMFSQIRNSISKQTGSLRDAFSGIGSAALVAESASTTATSAVALPDFELTEENRRFMATSSASGVSAASSGYIISRIADDRRVVRIATTSASSTQAP
jgi:hypothetical protein